MARRSYAVHFPAWMPWRARLFRFAATSLRSHRVDRAPGRWKVPPEETLARLARRAEARREWRYEAPGVWSAPVGAARAAWGRIRWR